MQLMHLSRKTGRVEVTKDNKWAMVIFQEGEVWHVEPRGFQGASPEEVLYAIMAMPDANFVLQRVHVLPMLERTVTMSTENLIMEGAKRFDDEAAIAQELGGAEGAAPGQPLKQVLTIRPGAESKVRYVPQNVKKVVQAVDGNRDISEVIQQCGLEADQATQIIKDLMAQGILDAVDRKQEPAEAKAS
jgi:hypothetical protein